IRDFHVTGVQTCALPISAVNEVDFSALESLETINRRLKDIGVRLHLSEVKGPVMDRLETSHFLSELTGRVFLSQFDAWTALASRSEERRVGKECRARAAP